MLKTLTLSAALVAAAAFLTPASAAPPIPQTGVAVEGAAEGLVQQVHWRRRHYRRHYWGYYYPRYDYYPRYYYPRYYGHYRHRHHHHRHHHRHRYY
jgi:hypothetical protein